MKTSKTFVQAFPLFLVIFIDGMGLGLLFPILSSIVLDPQSGFLPADMSVAVRDVWYGVTMSAFMVAWFFGAAILGDLSDMLGRKRSILICLIGSAIGFVISGLAVVWKSLSILIIGRLIDGFTAGSQPIAQAAIVNLVPDELKTRYLGYLLFCASMGFIFGPLLGGLLSQSQLISWFDYSTPFYFGALISVLNALLLWWLYHQPKVHLRKFKVNMKHAVDLFVSAFKHEQVKRLSVVFLFMELGWGTYFMFVPLYLYQTYKFTSLNVGLFISVMAVGFGIGTVYLVNFMSRRMLRRDVVIIGVFSALIAILVSVFPVPESVVWCTSLIAGIGEAVAYTAILSLFSEQVKQDEQGWVMGITGSIIAFAFAIVSLIAGFLASVAAVVPLVACVVFKAISIVLLRFYHKPLTKHETPQATPAE